MALVPVETQVNEGTVSDALSALFAAHGINENNLKHLTIKENNGQPRIYVVFVAPNE